VQQTKKGKKTTEEVGGRRKKKKKRKKKKHWTSNAIRESSLAHIRYFFVNEGTNLDVNS